MTPHRWASSTLRRRQNSRNSVDHSAMNREYTGTKGWSSVPSFTWKMNRMRPMRAGAINHHV